MPLFYLPLFSVWRSSFFFPLSSFLFQHSPFTTHHSTIKFKIAVPPARAVRSIFCLMLQQKDAAAIPTAPPFPLSTFLFPLKRHPINPGLHFMKPQFLKVPKVPLIVPAGHHARKSGIFKLLAQCKVNVFPVLEILVFGQHIIQFYVQDRSVATVRQKKPGYRHIAQNKEAHRIGIGFKSITRAKLCDLLRMEIQEKRQILARGIHFQDIKNLPFRVDAVQIINIHQNNDPVEYAHR